jgi:hypothetical protein
LFQRSSDFLRGKYSPERSNGSDLFPIAYMAYMAYLNKHTLKTDGAVCSVPFCCHLAGGKCAKPRSADFLSGKCRSQRKGELGRNNHHRISNFLEHPSFAAVPPEFYHHAGANSYAENPSPKSRAKAHTYGRHFKKVKYGNEVRTSLDQEILWTSYLSI